MSDVPQARFPQYQPVPPAPPAPPRIGTVAIVTGVIGLVVGALGVGLPWLLSGGSGLGGSSSSITAPGSLGNLKSLHDASVQVAGDKGAANAQRQAADDAQSAKLLSTAYSGAAATVAHYADGQLEDIVALFAVRAESPEPFVQYENLKELEEGVPQNQLVRVGDVACVVYNSQFVKSGPEPTEGVLTNLCQRSGNGMTVQIRPSGDLQHHPDQVAALVDDAWAAVY
jgi:hypothetical protein